MGDPGQGGRWDLHRGGDLSPAPSGEKGPEEASSQNTGNTGTERPIYPQGQVFQEEAPQDPPCETATLSGLWTAPPGWPTRHRCCHLRGESQRGMVPPHFSGSAYTVWPNSGGVMPLARQGAGGSSLASLAVAETPVALRRLMAMLCAG